MTFDPSVPQPKPERHEDIEDMKTKLTWTLAARKVGIEPGTDNFHKGGLTLSTEGDGFVVVQGLQSVIYVRATDLIKVARYLEAAEKNR